MRKSWFKYRFNENYFEKIDSEDKAYFLGLLYADGCNSGTTNVVSIALQKKDKSILSKLNKFMKSNVKAYVNKLNQKNPNHQDSYVLVFSSDKMSKDLERLGCVSNKSLVLKFPTEDQVPEYLLRHFVRGYFDGDGWVGSRIRGISEFIINTEIISTEPFLNQLEFFLNKNSIKVYTRKINRLIKAGNNITARLRTTSTTQSLVFLDWLYKDTELYITRKYKKYIKLKNLKDKDK
jgi:hypothetical protein